MEAVPFSGNFRSCRPQVFLGNGVLKICSKFTGEHPYRSASSINCTSAWLFSCKFSAYLQKQNVIRSSLNKLNYEWPLKTKWSFRGRMTKKKIMWNFQGPLFLALEFPRDLREHRQKTFVPLSRFWPLKGWEGGLSKFVKKRKFITKIFFTDIQ